MNILVTGGSGFIGSSLVKRLVNEGNVVRVLDNQSRGTKEHIKNIINDIDFIKGDIRDISAVKMACKGVDIVYHLAFVNGTEFFYSKPDVVLDVGVKGMINVLEASIENNVKEFILASSSEVYQMAPTIPTDETIQLSIPNPMNPRYSYGAGKIISEIMAINYGRKYFDRVLIFRPHNIYGPNMGFEHVVPQFIVRMNELINKSTDPCIKFPIKGSGEETRAFCYIDDFINGLMVMHNKGEHLNIYHIGTDQEVTIKEVAIKVGEYFNKDIQVIPGKEVEGGAPRRCPDINKLKKLGYYPHISLTEGIKKTIPWYLKNADKKDKKSMDLGIKNI